MHFARNRLVEHLEELRALGARVASSGHSFETSVVQSGRKQELVEMLRLTVRFDAFPAQCSQRVQAFLQGERLSGGSGMERTSKQYVVDYHARLMPSEVSNSAERPIRAYFKAAAQHLGVKLTQVQAKRI